MRNRLITTLAAASLFALGCQGRLFSITIRDSADTVVPRGTVLEELTGGLGFSELTAMDLISSGELANQGVEPGDIEEAVLTVFELEATGPDGADLSFLQSVSLYVEAPDLPRELVASRSGFEEGETVAGFDVTEVDLADYIVSRSMTLSTEVRGNRPDEDTEVRASFEVKVGVTGQGACNAL